ncbi:M6 family metalloprotease domain-containing protein [Prevotella sp.]|uniref:M6 family metalloprotease domain-containing protein n=1 Tax=Prevotella sp. TaxID=59823 RepID=UPI0027E33321|nr:M6 family metalloprotease domain-containing protein [Prevotella sp.]
MKKMTLLIMCLMIGLGSYAVPAQMVARHIGQPDGSVLDVYLYGDEHFHFFMTTDSVPVFGTARGLCYADIRGEWLVVSDVLAHNAPERKHMETTFVSNKTIVANWIRTRHLQRMDEANGKRIQRAASRRVGEPKQYVGSKRGLVILVNFANLHFKTENTQKEFDNLFNQKGYQKNGSIGSVHDYFYDQSYGKFDLRFDVVGPVTLSHDLDYYGANNVITNNDSNPKDMVVEACRMVDSVVDFADYDWDGDGEVDQVFVVYAGYGEHAGAPEETIWPHESRLGSKAISLDGIKINTYACSCELVGKDGNTLTGIGTPCHEFSHCLGLPDLYDTDYSGAFGMSYWDVMNSGSYSGPSNNGEVPYGYSAYERWFAGWLEPVEITSTQHIVDMKNVADKPEAYLIYNMGNRNEYYIIENHQPTRWFSYVANYTGIGGMLVSHVNYDKTAWTSNKVNPSPTLQRLSIIPADNSYGSTEEELRGDLFPGSKKVTLLSSTSHTATGGKMYNKNIDDSYYLNRTLNRIVENNDGTIGFDAVFAEDTPAPIGMLPFDISDMGYTAKWAGVDNAESYTVEQQAVGLGQSMMPVIKRQTIEGVQGTTLPMQWLVKTGTTKYRIKAIINGFESDWSGLVEVDRTTSGINPLAADNDEETIYGIDGLKYSHVRKGLNIVKRNGKAEKILVK